MRSRETDVSQWKLLDSGFAEGCESFRELIRDRLSQVIRWKRMTVPWRYLKFRCSDCFAKSREM